MKKDFALIAGLIMVGLIILFFLLSFSPLSARAEEMDLNNTFSSPSARHLFGTDQFGRDIFARIILSTRYVLLVSLGAVSLGALIGVVLGSLAGVGPSLLSSLILRLTEGMLAFPGILLALMLVFVLGKGIKNSVIAIAIFMVPVFCKSTYAMILEKKNLLYIKAAKSYGMGNLPIVVHHMLPGMMPKLFTQFTSNMSRAILTEGSLSFLGLGIQPPRASLGLMLSEARQYYLAHPFLGIPAGLVLMLAVLGFSLLGDYVNDLWIGVNSEED